MDKKRAPRKRKSPKAGAPNVRPTKGSSNGSTKKAGSSNGKGFPISQMILGVSLVAVVGVVAAIALGAVSVDDIKDSPVWIKAKALLDQTLGSEEGPDSPLDVNEEPPIVPTDDKDTDKEVGGDVKEEDVSETVEDREVDAEVPAQEIEEEEEVSEEEIEEEAEVPVQEIEEEVPVQESEEEAEVPVQEIEEEVPVQESEEEEEVPVKEEEQEEEVPLQEVEEEVPVQEEEEEAAPKEESEVEIPKEEEKPKDPMMNSEDEKIRDKIMAAEELLRKKQTELGLRKFEALLRTHPTSPRVRYGRAQALDQLAEERRSNELLQSCVTAYGEVKHAENCPDELKKAALRRQADRMSFQGKSILAADVLRSLSREFPDDVMIQKELGVQHLIMGQDSRAKPYFQRILQINPNDGFAKVHLGFILKREGNFEEAITNLEEGIASNEEGTTEGKYFFHLGDAYQRTGRPEESYRVYEIAAQRGLFRSAMQRSLYNVDSLHGQPWWTPKEAGIESAVKKLEDNWKVIQEEALALMNKETLLFEPEDESLRHTGDWKQYMLYMRGRKDENGCAGAPKTCKIIESIPDSAGCKRGQVKFSVMHPGTHVWPHTGPTNCRLRSHLGLVIPGGSRIRVVNETRTWEEGKVFIFDDSFEHEVWQEAESFRLVLIADFWHPDLTEKQKKHLSPI